MDAQSSIKFCFKCNYMMYPREDMETRQLYFECRSCKGRDKAEREQWCVHRNDLSNVSSQDLERSQLPFISQDPTLPRITSGAQAQCECGASEARVFYQKLGREEGIQQYFVCCNCYRLWTSPDAEGEDPDDLDTDL